MASSGDLPTDTAPPPARHAGVDAGRLVAAFSVVAVHINIVPLRSNIGGLIAWEVLCRWAVPFFFVAAGYYARRTSSISGTLHHIATRILPLILVWNAVYFAIEGPPPIKELWRIFVTGVEPGYHLWFLPSLAFCALLLALLRKVMGPVGLVVVGVLFYLAGLALGPYSQGLFATDFRGTWDTRNGPFFGLVFMAIGLLLRDKGTPPLAIGVALFLVGALLQAGEILWLLDTYYRAIGYTDFVLGTLPMGVGGFIVFRSLADRPLWRRIGAVGTLSFGVYAVHLLYLNALEPVLQTDRGSLVQGFVLLVLTCALSLATVWLIARVPPFRRFVT